MRAAGTHHVKAGEAAERGAPRAPVPANSIGVQNVYVAGSMRLESGPGPLLPPLRRRPRGGLLGRSGHEPRGGHARGGAWRCRGGAGTARRTEGKGGMLGKGETAAGSPLLARVGWTGCAILPVPQEPTGRAPGRPRVIVPLPSLCVHLCRGRRLSESSEDDESAPTQWESARQWAAAGG